MQLGPRVIFSIGNVYITETVCFALIISLLILLFCWRSVRNLQTVPHGCQAVAEWLVDLIYNWTEGAMGKENLKFAPYIGTLACFLGLGSMLGLLDLRPITADLNTTVPLALVTFILIHGNGNRVHGAGGYAKKLGSPYAFMFPLNCISDAVFPVTLACRLFGNIFAGMVVMSLTYNGLANLSAKLGSSIPFFQIFIPLPLNFFFDMFEPILQTFVFCMLTMVFTANAMSGDEG
jgi:F0F1-type ATP synthase, subunit a